MSREEKSLCVWNIVLKKRISQKNEQTMHMMQPPSSNEHTHPPSQTNCEVVKVKVSIKRRAETTADPSRQILADELSAISQTAAVNLQSMDNLRRNI